MSKWEKYKVNQQPISNNLAKWDKYKINKVKKEDDALGVIGKSFNRGFASILDLPQTALALSDPVINAPGKLYSAISAKEAPYNFDYFSKLKPLSQSVFEASDDLGYGGFNAPVINPDNTGKKILGKAAETAGAFIGGGAGGRAMQGLGAVRAGNFLGNPNSGKELVTLAKSGTGIGAGAGALEELGADPLSANIGASLAAPISGGTLAAAGKGTGVLKNFVKNSDNRVARGVAKTGSLLSNFTSKAKNPITNSFGLGKGDLNEKALTSAKDLGIELPTAAVANSRLTDLADQYVGKVPFFGDRLAAKYAKTESQTLGALEDLYDSVGPVKTPEVENKIKALYDNQNNLLPKDASTSARTTLDSIDNILAELDYPGLHKDGIELKKYLEGVKKDLSVSNPTVGKIGGENFKLPSHLQEQIGESIPVDDLIGLKRNVNNTVQWDNLKGTKSLLAKFQKDVSKNISEYGEKNPQWHESYRGADSFFGKVSKRERLEELLSGKSINAATDNFSYNSLSKVINDKKTASELKQIVSPENFEKIQKLGEVAKAMAQKSARTPNPSGTGPTQATAGAIGAVLGLYTYPIKTTLGAIGAEGLTRLLTSQRFLDRALKIATKEKPTFKELMTFNSEVKQLTGLSLAAISNAYTKGKQKEESEPDNKQSKHLFKKFKKSDS